MYDKIANQLFNLFIVNDEACAIQQTSGIYITKHVKFNPSIIVKMLEKKKAIGIYQQTQGKVKWVCIDFDCVDKENPNPELLYSEVVKKFLCKIERYNLSYLKEFSGRRGIHIWIIFDQLILKSEAYEIILLLLDKFEYDVNSYGIDIFPATPSSAKNKVGKQVKLPLSFHQKGSQSFFFQDEFSLNYNINIAEQSKILEDYQLQNTSLFNSLGVFDKSTSMLTYKKHTVNTNEEDEAYYDQVIKTLSELEPYEKLFDKLISGHLTHKDYSVLYGTSTGFSKNNDFFNYMMRLNPLYDSEISDKNLNKIKGKYGILTLRVLYNSYNCNLTRDLLEFETAVDYFVTKSENMYQIRMNNISYESELDILDNINYTSRKEKKYFFENDEVIHKEIFLEFLNGSKVLNNEIYQQVEAIKKDKSLEPSVGKMYKYLRKEKKKDRILISLGYWDRILTTQLALNVAYACNRFQNNKSHSYNINYASKDYLFYNWYSSWRDYTHTINTYLEIPFFEDMSLIQMDIEKFYDSVDFINVSKYILSTFSIDKEVKNQLNYLIVFNEKLMKKANNSRIGVPQGPAYARIISELFLDILLDQVLKDFPETILMRYVDDFVLICESTQREEIYFEVQKKLRSNGLKISLDKTNVFESLHELSDSEKSLINYGNKMSYEFNTSVDNILQTSDEKNIIVESILYNYNINDCSLVFSKTTDSYYKNRYFITNAKHIFSEESGRGSIFAKIYYYLFENENLIQLCCEKEYFQLLKRGSLNYKVFIHHLYMSIKLGNISDKSIIMIYDNFLTEEATNIEIGNVLEDIEIEEMTDELIVIEAINKYVEVEQEKQ